MKPSILAAAISSLLLASQAYSAMVWSTNQPVYLIGSQVCSTSASVHYFFLKNEYRTGTIPKPFYFEDSNPLKNDWQAKLLSAQATGASIQVYYNDDGSQPAPACAINPGYKVSAIQISSSP